MRTIGVVTTSRADYGIYRPVLSAIENDASLSLRLLVSGMHLSAEYGLTIEDIKSDGFKVHEQIESLVTGDGPECISESLGLGVIGFSKVFNLTGGIDRYSIDEHRHFYEFLAFF